MRNIKYINSYVSRNIFLIVLLCASLFYSCKDEDKPFGLSLSNLQLYQNETKEITVSGEGDFTTSLSDPLVVNLKVDGTVIRITGVRIGTTQLTVKMSSGEEKTCAITVVENQLDADLTKNPTTRIEWGSTVYYPEEKEGYTFSIQTGVDALGMSAINTVSYDFSVMGDTNSWIRVSASGDFTKAGNLSDGLVVIQKPGNQPECLIATQTILKQVKDGKTYLILYFPDTVVRIVTSAIE